MIGASLYFTRVGPTEGRHVPHAKQASAHLGAALQDLLETAGHG
jgi:hypothetical protein